MDEKQKWQKRFENRIALQTGCDFVGYASVTVWFQKQLTNHCNCIKTKILWEYNVLNADPSVHILGTLIQWGKGKGSEHEEEIVLISASK